MSLFISSGEASGDHYTANIARALRRNGYSGEIWGMGGLEARNAGINALWKGERLQLLGLTEVFSAIPSIFSLLRDMSGRIMEASPDAVIVCDSPDFHMRLIARLRKIGYKGNIFYISPPSVWAWRSGRADALRENNCICLPLFKFEHEFLLSRGCVSKWIGHPFVEEFKQDDTESDKIKSLFDTTRLVAFLPGSRGSEIKALLPFLLKSADVLAQKGFQPVFSVATGLNPVVREKMLSQFKNDGVLFYDGSGRSLMANSLCAVGASGTITVEALLLGCYMVVTYKLNPITAFAARCIIRIKHYAMANILAGCEMFPELLQNRATVENITSNALNWLNGSSDFRDNIKSIMKNAKLTLGEDGVYDFWCRNILSKTGII
ncbi:MAG: hypothetical protein Q4E17_01865 [Synergistes sp.]|nr:hypothetical protein [Synergistes sp.]